MKRLLFILQLPLFLCFNFFLLLTVYQIAGSSSTSSTSLLHLGQPTYNHIEEYDESLQRLDNMDALTAYCDSLYAEKQKKSTLKESDFPDLVSTVVRNRFYHGYSEYGYHNNYMSMLLSQASIKGLNAIVIPDDILKHKYAACSQQSIILMELLRKKGYGTRKVGLQGKYNGHFCYEVFYNGSWHFYDPDMEPDMKILNMYGRPDVAFLASRPDILLKAYRHVPKEKVLDIFSTYHYGQVNTFAAPQAIIFQKITKVFSYTIWIFFLLAFILVRRKYLQRSRFYVRNNRIHIPTVPEGTPAMYYPKYTA